MLSLKVGEINFGQLPIFYKVNGRDLTIRPGCLLVAKSKNKETREIPMNQEVHEALKAVVADAPAGDSVFTFSRNGVSTATKNPFSHGELCAWHARSYAWSGQSIERDARESC